MVPTIVAPEQRTLVGESPVWDDRTGHLYWVDILGKAIFRLDPQVGTTTRFETEDFPTAIGLCQSDGKAIIAFAGGVSFWELGTNNYTPFVSLDEDPDGNRLNEGAVGPDGAFWVGTMQTNINPDGSMRDMDRNSGALYRIDPDGTTTRHTDHSFGISNTLAWDESRGAMYFGDTLAQTLYRFDWPLEGIKDPLEPWAVNKENGFPDGSCIDDDGHVWNARYAGSCLLRFAPDGSVVQKLDLPATNITACTFGGADQRTLYVTTAANQLDDAQLDNPAEGALLALDVGVSGPATYRFGA